ncbi:MAG: phaZ [Acidimicrobiaceae bacterium]|nr:phaZ [Acidimicrobiaceae bacterium]
MSTTRSSQSKEVSARGHQIHVRIEGWGEPLLLINGLTRPMSSWDHFVAALGERTVVSFDAPGVGSSAASLLPLSIVQLSDLASSILDELGIDCADVLGYSHGGAVAQQFAVSHSEQLSRLILVATSCGIGSTLATDSRDSVALLTRGLLRTNALSALWRTIAFSTWSSIPFLGAIEAPTLVVCGRGDNVTPLANSQLLAGRIPDATLVALDESHDLQGPGAAEKLADVVEEFLEREPRRTSEHAEL